MSDEHELDAAYRAASKHDAGAPPAALRARILAEAAAASRRRMPAANASTYWLRGLAGVAVLGVVVVLLREVDYQLPGESSTTVTVQAQSDAPTPDAEASGAERVAAPTLSSDTLAQAATEAKAVESQPAAEPAEGAGRADVQRRSSVQEKAIAEADSREEALPASAPAPPPATSPAAPTLQAAAPPPPPPGSGGAQSTAQRERFEAAADAAANSDLEEVAVTASRNESAERERASVPGPRAPLQGLSTQLAAESRQSSAAQLLQTHFPEQYQSARSHRLWLVRSADGEVLRVGEAQAAQSLTQIAREVEASLGRGSVTSWQTESLRNARGQAIELNIGELR